MLNKNIEFSVDNKFLRCRLNKSLHYKFFNLDNIEIV